MSGKFTNQVAVVTGKQRCSSVAMKPLASDEGLCSGAASA